ncbi:MAG: metallophosphoesterase [Clostridia bacterium]|nr:metallophosphoesterase [Clostridia bacterium]
MTKVTCLGDSIRVQYTPRVTELLGENFTVFSPNDNCRFAKYTLRGIFDWAPDMEGSRIVHWNNGIWDTARLFDDGPFTSDEEFLNNMLRIADILKKRYEIVIFATITPAEITNPYHHAEDIIRFNELLVPRLKEKGLLINDLYSVVAADPDRFISQDRLHLSPDGVEACAQKVAKAIIDASALLKQSWCQKGISMIRPRHIKKFDGCDTVVQLGRERKGTKIRLLQITDMQFIDATQRRTPDRLGKDEIIAWSPKNYDAQGGDHIRSLIAQTRPDVIFITGDIIYGEFDDNGSVLSWFCSFMDSFGIPWAPVFGNHDNESAMGVKWQCELFESSRYCLFKRGTVSGNSNYTVGLACGDELVRVLYMLDSNGCGASNHPEVIKRPGIYPDQVSFIKDRAERIRASQHKQIPAFMAYHIPTEDFWRAELARGYAENMDKMYVIGVDVCQRDDDFGMKHEKYSFISTPESFLTDMKACGVDGVFVGHCHKNNTCIRHDGVRFVFGLKTAQYDYHMAGQLGGTLITLEGDDFTPQHVPALVKYAPFPRDMRVFRNFFADEK